MSLPTQQHVMKAIARTMGELGGLRDGLLRLATDMGPGIDVNRSLGRQRPDGRWGLDRVLPRIAPDQPPATVRLSGPLVDGRGGEIAVANATLVIHDDAGGTTEHPGGAVVPLPATDGDPAHDEVLVTVVLTIPDLSGGPLWTGHLLHDTGGATPDDHRVEFWIRDLP